MIAQHLAAMIVTARSTEPVAPTQLLASLSSEPNPLEKVADVVYCETARDTITAEFPELRQGYWAVGHTPVSDNRAAGVMGWLIQGLTQWSSEADPMQRNLAAMLLVILALGDSHDVWNAVAAEVVANTALHSAFEKIVSGSRCRIAPRDGAGLSETEAFASLQKADTDQDWKAISEAWPRFNLPFYNPLMRIAVRGLMQFAPDRLEPACRKLPSVVDCMLIAQSLDVAERLSIAKQSSSPRLRFCLICSALDDNGRRPLTASSQINLAEVLISVAQDADLWSMWMQIFTRHAVRYPVFHLSLGRALASVSDEAVAVYVTTIHLDIGHAISRDAVTDGLRIFHNTASLPRRQLLWRLAYERWREWAFAKADPDTVMTQIFRTELDYAVVGYCLECGTEAERTLQTNSILAELRLIESRWYASQLHMITSWFRGLSMLQPFFHANGAASPSVDWLAIREAYFPYDPDDAYFRLRFGAAIPRSQPTAPLASEPS